jgi:hypothetical protein
MWLRHLLRIRCSSAAEEHDDDTPDKQQPPRDRPHHVPRGVRHDRQNPDAHPRPAAAGSAGSANQHAMLSTAESAKPKRTGRLRADARQVVGLRSNYRQAPGRGFDTHNNVVRWPIPAISDAHSNRKRVTNVNVIRYTYRPDGQSGRSMTCDYYPGIWEHSHAPNIHFTSDAKQGERESIDARPHSTILQVVSEPHFCPS